MANPYSPRQNRIRSICLQSRKETITYIRNQQWDLVQGNQCNHYDCTVCSNPVMSPFPLRQIFTCIEKMTPEVQKTIERIYGEQTSESWLKMMLESCPPIRVLSYFVENNLIQANDSFGRYSLLGYYNLFSSKYTWKGIFDTLLSPEIGYDINIQTEDGSNCLLSVIFEDYYDGEDRMEYMEETQEESITLSNQKIQYLLEKGADPLLENKEGVCALTYARQLQTYPDPIKSQLIELLEQYV